MLGTSHFTNIFTSTQQCIVMIKRITGNIFYTLRVSVSQDCLSLFYSQEKLLQQLRARKVKLQQSKSDRIIQLMSEGGRLTPLTTTTTSTTVAPQLHHRVDSQHLEAPQGSPSPLTESSLDQLLARLESLEVRDLQHSDLQKERDACVYRKGRVRLVWWRWGMMELCVLSRLEFHIKYTTTTTNFSPHNSLNKCRWHNKNRN